jgi:hypothetical protein
VRLSSSHGAVHQNVRSLPSVTAPDSLPEQIRAFCGAISVSA